MLTTASLIEQMAFLLFIISCVLTPSLASFTLLALVSYGGTLAPLWLLSRMFPLYLAFGTLLVLMQQLFNIPFYDTQVRQAWVDRENNSLLTPRTTRIQRS